VDDKQLPPWLLLRSCRRRCLTWLLPLLLLLLLLQPLHLGCTLHRRQMGRGGAVNDQQQGAGDGGAHDVRRLHSDAGRRRDRRVALQLAIQLWSKLATTKWRAAWRREG
jgi:hypothetical protein